MVISKGQDRHSEGGMGINRGLRGNPAGKIGQWRTGARAGTRGEPRSTSLKLVCWARTRFLDDDFDSHSQLPRKVRCSGWTTCYLYVHYMYGRNRVRMGAPQGSIESCQAQSLI